MWDVLGLGCTAIDDLLYVPAYPEPDSKMQFRRKERHCGGLTGTALVAAARLGSRSRLPARWAATSCRGWSSTALRRRGSTRTIPAGVPTPARPMP